MYNVTDGSISSRVDEWYLNDDDGWLMWRTLQSAFVLYKGGIRSGWLMDVHLNVCCCAVTFCSMENLTRKYAQTKGGNNFILLKCKLFSNSTPPPIFEFSNLTHCGNRLWDVTADVWSSHNDDEFGPHFFLWLFSQSNATIMATKVLWHTFIHRLAYAFLFCLFLVCRLGFHVCVEGKEQASRQTVLKVQVVTIEVTSSYCNHYCFIGI